MKAYWSSEKGADKSGGCQIKASGRRQNLSWMPPKEPDLDWKNEEVDEKPVGGEAGRIGSECMALWRTGRPLFFTW